MGIDEALVARVLQVRHNHLVVQRGPHVRRGEVRHRVQIPNVQPPRVGLRAVGAVLLHMHATELQLEIMDSEHRSNTNR